ncbi:MAG TPA: hexose kinase [Streptosporangiaceae bacterium]
MTGPILLVTLNPALDVTYHLASVDWAGVNRPADVLARPGGKGLNVAFTLRALGACVRVTGLAGGSTGAALRDAVAADGLQATFAPISGETRRTFTVVDTGLAQMAAFYEPGPCITSGEFAAFEADYAAALHGAAVVVLTGSLPPGLAPDTYAALIRRAALAGVPTVLDAGGEVLRLGAAAGPAIIKPNLAELEQAAGRRLRGAADDPDLAAVAAAARDLLATGAHAVVVSLGPDGLLALTGSDRWHVVPADVPVSNPTGAGDAVVAGLALGLARGWTWPERLRHAAALGAATVAAPVAGEFDRALYERLLASMPVPGLLEF